MKRKVTAADILWLPWLVLMFVVRPKTIKAKWAMEFGKQVEERG